MNNIFKIAKYSKVGNQFVHTGYVEYSITYLKGINKPHMLRIVVNNILTKQTINIIDGKSGYKRQLLKAVKEYREMSDTSKEKLVSKKLTLQYIENLFSKKVVHNVKNILLTINKEESRDTLSEYGLIDSFHDGAYKVLMHSTYGSFNSEMSDSVSKNGQLLIRELEEKCMDYLNDND